MSLVHDRAAFEHDARQTHAAASAQGAQALATPPRVVLCDGDELYLRKLRLHLSEQGYECSEAHTGAACLELATRTAPDCVVLDLAAPEMDGLTVLRRLRQRNHRVPVVLVAENGGVDSAIEATRLGAQAYLRKSQDVGEVGRAVGKLVERRQQARRVAHCDEPSAYGDFVGRSPALAPLFATLDKLEHVTAPTVLILGESGTGKDVLARAIHERGPRKDTMYVEVDCPSLPETLLESELFGHERGAFTDARQTKRGLFEVAGKGTVFLDEIGDLAAGSQAKLLRALQNRRFKRVGGVSSLPLDAAVIAATNRDLRAEVAAGRFREDLLYRLDVVTLTIPPLRARKDDIPLLVAHFLDLLNRRFGRDMEGVTPAAMECLLAYDWPGNVRELRNVLERIAILSPSSLIDASDLPSTLRYPRSGEHHREAHQGLNLPEHGVDLAELERDFVLQALARTEGNRTEAGRLLGLSRFQLRTRIQRYGLTEYQ